MNAIGMTMSMEKGPRKISFFQSHMGPVAQSHQLEVFRIQNSIRQNHWVLIERFYWHVDCSARVSHGWGFLVFDMKQPGRMSLILNKQLMNWPNQQGWFPTHRAAQSGLLVFIKAQACFSQKECTDVSWLDYTTNGFPRISNELERTFFHWAEKVRVISKCRSISWGVDPNGPVMSCLFGIDCWLCKDWMTKGYVHIYVHNKSANLFQTMFQNKRSYRIVWLS